MEHRISEAIDAFVEKLGADCSIVVKRYWCELHYKDGKLTGEVVNTAAGDAPENEEIILTIKLRSDDSKLDWTHIPMINHSSKDLGREMCARGPQACVEFLNAFVKVWGHM